MRRTIFYSWQSDLPNSTNRTFIGRALEDAAREIHVDDSVDVEPVVDRDTQGVAGSPDISKIIFEKIDNADIFVADVSLVNATQSGRLTPNPNVLLELGYAMKALGNERVILVFNTAFGRLEELPFDLRMRRAMPYAMEVGTEDRTKEREALKMKLNAAIRAALTTVPQPISPISEAVTAVENNAPNRVIIVRRLLADLYQQIQTRRPTPISQGGTGQQVLDAIRSTVDLASGYIRLASMVALMKDWEVLLELHRGFGPFIEAYSAPRGFSGPFHEADTDLVRFLGHELYTALVACLIREGRWELLSNCLRQPIRVNNGGSRGEPANLSFDSISAHLGSLIPLSRELKRNSLHSDMLQERYEGPLRDQITFAEFTAADYFLYLRGELQSDEPRFAWRPWSTLYMSKPLFLLDAEDANLAALIAVALNCSDTGQFRQRLRDRLDWLAKLWFQLRAFLWHCPIQPADIEKIGSR